MVYITPPDQTAPGRSYYDDAYNNILAAHRRSPLTSASSVVMLVAPDVDALCASKMLARLFRQDDVIYTIIPVAGVEDFTRVREELRENNELHTLILLNVGGYLDLPSPNWFGEFRTSVTIHVIDSIRPRNLSSLFGTGENGDRIIVWDDGEADKLMEEKKAWEALEYEPLPDSDDEYSDEESEGDRSDGLEYEGDSETEGSRKRRLSTEPRRGKRRRLNDDDDDQPRRMTREEHDHHVARLNKYYLGGTWYGQSVSSTIYALATILERVDNDFLWFAILGLTHQYLTSRITREDYETYHRLYYDEVSRLNPLPPGANAGSAFLLSLSPDDVSVRTTEELRFMFFRHWTLYDAMYHSSYVASKLGIWKERGRKRLTGLLAKMGFSLLQTQQSYTHMDMDLKRVLVDRFNETAPEYGLVELSYPSFVRCYGYRSQPFSAADAIEGISALIDVAGGLPLEIEVEGARNGGEWFGGGRAWETPVTEGRKGREDARLNGASGQDNMGTQNEGKEQPEVAWWVKNFWIAYDALSDFEALRQSTRLSMSLHRSIIEQGTSIIDKQDIRTMRNHRVVVMTQGPKLELFSHPGVLMRLALWLVDALRDRVPASQITAQNKRKGMPFVVACLDERKDAYSVVGVTAAMEFGDVKKNHFALAFVEARDRCNATIHHSSFDTSVIEVQKEHIKTFLAALCEGPD
ncbi:cell division control protein 45 [Macrolepiota fuliginosa MF-IS2]|uniref:Cell division control protein 45 n=1 Tax=Macrolepiota fuliginosa MF-IS2 TaxID=1400762 RepID=A0A9P6C8T8_9AGAR|nr:cell division control protein 45 [Macrolepiota fuliginosa MF-IS2]